MIVEPDFLTHWKTQLLIVELADKAAPLYVIALWAHCQQRRSDTFTNLAPNALKAICRYEGEASKLRSALERCGFLDVDGDAIVVHGWAETNSKLMANWTNGSLGGRPPGSGKKKGEKTQRKPNGNPNSNWGNPQETDKSREEEKGVEVPPLPPKGGDGSGAVRVLPTNWKKLSAVQKRRTNVLVNNKLMIRIGRFVGRPPEKLWTVAEAVALSELGPPPDDEVKQMAAYYGATIADEDKDIRRRDLITLLNNWSGELDRARLFSAKKP